MSQPNTGSKTKVQPIRARLEKFSTREEFARGYRQYITSDGILLPTRQVKDIGTQIALKLEIADGTVGLRADGEVTEHRQNSKGQTVAMFIRFHRIDPASQAVVQLALAEASSAAPRSVDEPAADQTEAPDERPDLDAFAEELDSTFDSIFSSGAFSAVSDTSDSDAPASSSSGLSIGTAPRLATSASEADGAPQEWANTLSSDFAVVEASDAAEARDGTEPDDERTGDRAAQLLAAFGVNAPDSDESSDDFGEAADTGTPQDMPAIGATTENSSVQPVARISVGKAPASGNPRAAALLKNAADNEAAARKTAGAAWLESAASDSGEQSAVQSDELRQLIAHITSDHAVVESTASAMSPAEIAPTSPRAEQDDDELFADLVDEQADHVSPPPAVLKGASADEQPDDSDTTSASEGTEDDSAAGTDSADTSSTAAPAARNRPPAPVPATPSKGIFARFFAWLASLFGGGKS